MNEREPTLNGAAPDDYQAHEAEVRRLLERAGPRAPIPAEDLEAITAAARAAWRAEVERREVQPLGESASQSASRQPDRSGPEIEDGGSGRPESQMETRRRRAGIASPGRAWAMPLALAAMLLLSIGLAWWWTTSRGRAGVVVARVETIVGQVFIETVADSGPGDRRLLVAGSAIPAGAALITAGGTEPASAVARLAGRASLRLPDGTVLRLDAGSRLRIDSPAALALDRGALYADTGDAGPSGQVASATGPAPDAPRLVVTTPAGTAHDIGTRFAVRLAEPAGSALEVRVRDGAVALERDGRRWVAPAGEELVVDADGTPRRRPIDPYGPEWQWVLEAAAGYPIEGRTLGEFLDWVVRETGWRVRWADPALEATARTIVLRGGIGPLRPDQTPAVVLPGAGLEGELAGGTLVIRRR